MREQYIEYRDGETLLEGFLCYDEAQPVPRPTVLICHAYGGRDEFVERKARRLAYQGYACFALDNYGKGVRGKTPEESSALMNYRYPGFDTLPLLCISHRGSDLNMHSSSRKCGTSLAQCKQF